MADLIEEDDGMVNINLQMIGPSPRSRLRLPSTIKVKELRKLIAGTSHLPLENMKLVFRGNVLHDSTNGDDLLVQLSDGDSVIVAIKPKPPAKHVFNSLDDDDDEDLVSSKNYNNFQNPAACGKGDFSLFYVINLSSLICF